MILVTYFDSHTSCTQSARLTVKAGEAVLFESEGTVLRRVPFSTLQVSGRAEYTPRLIASKDGAFCGVDYPAGQMSLNVLLHHTDYHRD